MYTIRKNKSAKNIIKHIRYKLNEQLYFDIETYMETDTWRVFKPWTRYAPPPEGGGVFNIGRPVRCRNPLWEGRTRDTFAASSRAMIWPVGNNGPNCSLFLPWIKFVRRTLTLIAKDTWRVVDQWTWDTPTTDGNVWVWRIRQAQKGLLQSPICWGCGDRCMGDQLKEDGFGGKVLLQFQIRLWAVQGQFGQEGEL